MSKSKKNLQRGITLTSQSGYATLRVKPYPASKAKEIVTELMELAKSIAGMKTLADVGECPCGDCRTERRMAETLAKGTIVVIKKDGSDTSALADEIMEKYREAVNSL